MKPIKALLDRQSESRKSIRDRCRPGPGSSCPIAEKPLMKPILWALAGVWPVPIPGALPVFFLGNQRWKAYLATHDELVSWDFPCLEKYMRRTSDQNQPCQLGQFWHLIVLNQAVIGVMGSCTMAEASSGSFSYKPNKQNKSSLFTLHSLPPSKAFPFLCVFY